MAIKYLFPGGRSKALTMSYDDGVDPDIRLAELFRQHGLKGTFHLNSGLLGGGGSCDTRRLRADELESVYAGMEVATHTVSHPFLERIDPISALNEVLEDRRNLEAILHRPITGMSYPMGTSSEQVQEILRICGIEYSRTNRSTGSFAPPENFLMWDPTCHHNDPRLMELAESFLTQPPFRTLLVFYVYGHAYEFGRDDNWSRIEAFAEKMGGHSDIWYATNLEICRYLKAARSLIVGADGTMAYNPTALEIWVRRLDRDLRIAPGETVFF